MITFNKFINEIYVQPMYEYSLKKEGENIIIDIFTGEKRDYRLKFFKKEHIHVVKMGYAHESLNEINEEFYNISKLVSTLVDIFIGTYINNVGINNFLFSFEGQNNVTFKLLINSIFKKELSNYYSIVLVDNKDYSKNRYIVIRNKKNQDEIKDKQYYDNIFVT